MGKRNKKEWQCGDCNAVMPKTKSYCDAPEHDFAEKTIHQQMIIEQLREEIYDLKLKNNTVGYLTVEEFVTQYSAALREYLHKMYSTSGSLHPEDLSSATASFAEANWITLQHMKF